MLFASSTQTHTHLEKQTHLFISVKRKEKTLLTYAISWRETGFWRRRKKEKLKWRYLIILFDSFWIFPFSKQQLQFNSYKLKQEKESEPTRIDFAMRSFYYLCFFLFCDFLCVCALCLEIKQNKTWFQSVECAFFYCSKKITISKVFFILVNIISIILQIKFQIYSEKNDKKSNAICIWALHVVLMHLTVININQKLFTILFFCHIFRHIYSHRLVEFTFVWWNRQIKIMLI
jgi:hypothetical protein